MSDETQTIHPLESEFMLSMLQMLKDHAKCSISLHIMKEPILIEDKYNSSHSFEKEDLEQHIARNEQINYSADRYKFIIHPFTKTKIRKDTGLHNDKIIRGYPTSINLYMKNMIESLIKNIQAEFEKNIWNYNVQNHPMYDVIKLIQEYKKDTEGLGLGASIFGDKDSMAYYMETLYNGDCEQQGDKEHALKWAVKLNNDYDNNLAKILIAQAYNYGEGGYEEDKRKACNMYEDLVRRDDDAICIYDIGLIYEYGGNNMEKNIQKAFEWYEKGHKKHWDCSIKYANCCYDGNGCKKNKKKACEIYETWSDQIMEKHRPNIDDAMWKSCYNYGILLVEGVYIEQDKKNGMKYIKHAADNGNRNAKKKLNDYEKYILDCENIYWEKCKNVETETEEDEYTYEDESTEEEETEKD